jgi:hypothetical protein
MKSRFYDPNPWIEASRYFGEALACAICGCLTLGLGAALKIVGVRRPPNLRVVKGGKA